MHTPRWSELSFQCSGEAQYSNESVWLRSPIDKSNLVNNNMLDEKHDDLPERTVESWLSDTSSSFEHEEEVLVSFPLILNSPGADIIGLRHSIIAFQSSSN